MLWIKVETRTPYKPEIDRIMVMCKCGRAEAFLGMFQFYCWADQVTEDGRIEFLTKQVADQRSGLKGFGEALGDVGWVVFDAKGGTIQNYERHNGKSAKKRALNYERVKRCRGDDVNGNHHPGKPIEQRIKDTISERGMPVRHAPPPPDPVTPDTISYADENAT